MYSGELLSAPPVMSRMFLDPRLSHQVAMIHPKLQPEQPVQRPAKRLRPSMESKTLPEVIAMINGLLPVRSLSGELAILEDEIM